MIEIESVDALDFRLTAGAWDFARERAAEIAAHWAKRSAAQPRLFNGRVLMLGRNAVETRDDVRVLKGEFVETDFADFLAWRDFGFPASNACNGFAMAALRGADGAFVLGEMSAHTASAGAIYFPAGTPDRQDLFGEVVDLDASVRRELFEETGLRAEETAFAPGWNIVRSLGRVACMKPVRLPASAEVVKARVEAELAADPKAEFSRIHIVCDEADFSDRMPAFVRAYMRHVFAGEGAVHQTLLSR